MTRLSPEREKDIRDWLELQFDPSFPAFELLAEIDALREESNFRNESAKGYAEKCGILRAELEHSEKGRKLAHEEASRRLDEWSKMQGKVQILLELIERYFDFKNKPKEVEGKNAGWAYGLANCSFCKELTNEYWFVDDKPVCRQCLKKVE